MKLDRSKYLNQKVGTRTCYGFETINKYGDKQTYCKVRCDCGREDLIPAFCFRTRNTCKSCSGRATMIKRIQDGTNPKHIGGNMRIDKQTKTPKPAIAPTQSTPKSVAAVTAPQHPRKVPQEYLAQLQNLSLARENAQLKFNNARLELIALLRLPHSAQINFNTGEITI